MLKLNAGKSRVFRGKPRTAYALSMCRVQKCGIFMPIMQMCRFVSKSYGIVNEMAGICVIM